MEDKFEKKLKELLPYIIVTGILYLLLPLFMGTSAGVATYIIELILFPLTAVGCCVHYKLIKKGKDLYICGIAPIFYALTALLYGMWRSSWITVVIYLIGYLICGFLGLMITDLIKPKASQSPKKPSVPKRDKSRRQPRKVNVEDSQISAHFKAENPDEDRSLDTSTTDDDIEAILQSIHNRNNF